MRDRKRTILQAWEGEIETKENRKEKYLNSYLLRGERADSF